jgi:uncharacterized RDD family membrane protein YckC
MSIEWSPLSGAAGGPAAASGSQPAVPSGRPATPPQPAREATAELPTAGDLTAALDHGGVPVASLARRAAAALLDGLVFVAAAFVFLLIAAIANGGHFHYSVGVMRDSTSSELLSASAVLGGVWLVPLVYWAVAPQLGKAAGRSLGMRSMKVRVVGADGTPATSRALWTRSAVLVAPFTIGAIVGPLLDAAASTPPFITLAFVAVAYLSLLVDVVLAPLRGELRQTLADRVAGTVVIDDRYASPAEPGTPLLVAGRPRTNDTSIYGLVSGTLIAAALVGVGIIGFTGPKGPEPLPASFYGVQDMTAIEQVQQFRTKVSEYWVKHAGGTLGRQLAVCFAEYGSPEDCLTDRALHLPDGTLTFVDDAKHVESASIAKARGTLMTAYLPDKGATVVAAIDTRKTLWGYTIDSGGTMSTYCSDLGTVHACKTVLGKAFLGDPSTIEEALADARRVIASQPTDS